MRDAPQLKTEVSCAFLASGTPEAADRYRLAKLNAALVIIKAKTQAWEEFARP